MILFTGCLSGDMECFCWDSVPESERKSIVGNRSHSIDEEFGDRLDRLYPEDVFRKLGLDKNKKYRFTISVEPVD